jgi:hypothetical protein
MRYVFTAAYVRTVYVGVAPWGFRGCTDACPVALGFGLMEIRAGKNALILL